MAGHRLAAVAAAFIAFSAQVLADFAVIEPGTIANTSSASLSSDCVSAIESSVQCDPYLQLSSQFDEYGADNVTQEYVCTTDCASSLETYITNAESACAGQSPAWDGLPHAYYGKILQATYNLSCLKDPSTGVYCTNYLLGFGSATVSELTLEQACSPCMLSVGQQIQSTSYSNYDEDLADQWTALQGRCGTSYDTDIQPPDTNATNVFGYAVDYPTATSCWSDSTYTVVSGDNCGSIAISQDVATGSLITLNNILPGCTNLQIGQVLCLPETCTTYSVQPGDTCFGIADTHGITFTQLLSYNPSLNPTCTNLISGTNICVSLPGGAVYNATAIAGATATQTGSYATATISPPSGVAFGTTANCGKYYQVVTGDFCQIVALKNNIDLALFQAINPSINADCTNLIPDLYYCVWPTETWNQTTPTTTVYTTMAPPAPTVSGASDACYTWYIVQPGDACYKIIASYGITMDEFLAWNAGVDEDCTNIIAGDAYCVDALPRYDPSSTISVPTTTTPTPVVTPTPFPANMISGCETFHLVVDGDYCALIASEAGIDVATFQEWNPDTGEDCVVWLGYYYCIGL